MVGRVRRGRRPDWPGPGGGGRRAGVPRPHPGPGVVAPGRGGESGPDQAVTASVADGSVTSETSYAALSEAEVTSVGQPAPPVMVTGTVDSA